MFCIYNPITIPNRVKTHWNIANHPSLEGEGNKNLDPNEQNYYRRKDHSRLDLAERKFTREIDTSPKERWCSSEDGMSWIEVATILWERAAAKEKKTSRYLLYNCMHVLIWLIGISSWWMVYINELILVFLHAFCACEMVALTCTIVCIMFNFLDFNLAN